MVIIPQRKGLAKKTASQQASSIIKKRDDFLQIQEIEKEIILMFEEMKGGDPEEKQDLKQKIDYFERQRLELIKMVSYCDYVVCIKDNKLCANKRMENGDLHTIDMYLHSKIEEIIQHIENNKI